MKLYEAKHILKKNGYRLDEDYTDEGNNIKYPEDYKEQYNAVIEAMIQLAKPFLSDRYNIKPDEVEEFFDYYGYTDNWLYNNINWPVIFDELAKNIKRNKNI